MTIRRIRRVIAERAHAVHPELQSSSYLMLSWLDQHGPAARVGHGRRLRHRQGRDQPPGPAPGRLGLVDRAPDPADGRATLISVSAGPASHLAAVAGERRRWLDERLRDWSDEDLAAFADLLGRYNAALDERA